MQPETLDRFTVPAGIAMSATLLDIPAEITPTAPAPPAETQDCPLLAPHANIIAAARAGRIPSVLASPRADCPNVMDPNDAARYWADETNRAWEALARPDVAPEPFASRARAQREHIVATLPAKLSALSAAWEDYKAERIGKVVLMAGYEKREVRDLFAAAKEADAVIVDIRYAPERGREGWTGADLARVFRSRYTHIKALGNKNFDGGPIDIADMDAGISAVKAIAAKHVPILLCACARPARCHRSQVAEALIAAGYDVSEMSWPSAPRKA